MSVKSISSLILVTAALVAVPVFAQTEPAAGTAGASAGGLAEGSIVTINAVTFTVIGGVLVASTNKSTTTATATATATR